MDLAEALKGASTLEEWIALLDAQGKERAEQSSDQPMDRTALLRTWLGSPYYHQVAQQISRALRAGVPCTLTRKEWERTLAHFDHRCAYCGLACDLFVMEHWHPHASGGGFTADNIIPACRHCNQSRGNADPYWWAHEGGGHRKGVRPEVLAKIEHWRTHGADFDDADTATDHVRY